MAHKLFVFGFLAVSLSACSSVMGWIFPEEPAPTWDILPYTFDSVVVTDQTDTFENKPDINIEEHFGPGKVRLIPLVKQAFPANLFAKPNGKMKINIQEFSTKKKGLAYHLNMKATFEASHPEAGVLYKTEKSCALQSNERISIGYSENPETGERTPIELPGLTTKVVWERLFKQCVREMLFVVNKGIGDHLREQM